MRSFFYKARYGLTWGLAALALTGCGSDVAADCGGLAVDDAWVRAAAPGVEVMGAYFVLSNAGDTVVSVNAIESVQFERAEMHETIVNDHGQASMQPLERVTVGPGGRVAFEPAGKHVMLFSPSQTYAAGDQVELVLHCGQQNATLPVAAVVRARPPAGKGMMQQENMNHDDMGHGAG